MNYKFTIVFRILQITNSIIVAYTTFNKPIWYSRKLLFFCIGKPKIKIGNRIKSLKALNYTFSL